MKIIRHRLNTMAELKATPACYGVEVDIRSRGDELIIHHDPFASGEPFEEWLGAYRHGTLILNVKEEGLEGRLLELLESRGMEDYFLLDQSFPFLLKWAPALKGRCAVRVSEFESVETALALAGKARWVWVDCFSTFPLSGADACRLKDAGFRLCLVSPELQGRDPDTEVPELVRLLGRRGIEADAVCTKRPDLWERVAQ
ncbi:hypothetical protein LPW11_17785 [Geomonas sp. RF6]|uniref:hypothetical protein n=1 Tax=Geomonas sp. RF6 TaxID=2897342 RepID=UPI001E4AABEB|nr:hypothetical protein [Geomonas sp. RF6]UFS69733.1 hypothetical protein LPW11_17785 [Geomonas sp. RF6]